MPLFYQVGGLVILAIGLAGAVWLLWAMTLAPADASKETIVCLALWWLGSSVMIGLTFLNFLPTVWVAEEGLEISAFITARVPIPWSSLVDVGIGRVRFGYTLVRARRITPFHRLYGWMYSHSLLPAFVIHPDIDGYAELIREIQTRIAAQGH